MIKEPIRILCVFSTLDRGGAESMCMNLYRNIDRSRVQFDFVKHTHESCAYDDEICQLGGRIYVCPRFSPKNVLEYMKWWKRHFKKHPEHRIVHGHYFTISPIYFCIAHSMHRVTIGHSHAEKILPKSKQVLSSFTELFADYRLACSYKAGKLIYPHKEFTILRNAIDTNLYRYNSEIAEEVRKEFNIEDSFVIGTVGTIKSVKNPVGMVEILSEVSKVRPNTKLLWVGKDAGMQKEAESRLGELGLSDLVIFTGTRSDVNRLMQAMDAFILPSFSEGIPVVMIEAQAAGLPCFVSEAVSRDTDIAGLCRYLPLGEWASWAKEITTYNENRKDTSQAVKAAGYDIHNTAAWLQEFYLRIDKSLN